MNQHLKQQHTTTQWSGGTTTELLIYPETADYKLGNYVFRLSTATVEAHETTFTLLKGVDRTLVVLEGTIELTHEGHHTVVLEPLDIDLFKGDWTTHSKGTCVDFNLMCTSGAGGEANAYSLVKNAKTDFLLDGIFNFIYVHSGSIGVAGKVLHAGDLLRLDDTLTPQTVSARQESTFVVVKIVDLP